MLANLLGLSEAWNSIMTWWGIVLGYGVVGLVIAGLIAAGLFLPFGPRVRITCWVAAAAVLGHAFAFAWGAKTGAERVQADWDWAIKVEHVEGEKHRADAERLVVDEPPDRLSNDPRNRDGWPSGSKP
jgi:hypothetical protein